MKTKLLKHKVLQNRLQKLAGFIHRHTYTVLFIFASFTVYFASLALRLEQKTSVRDLLPADNQVVRNFEETVDQFDLIDRVVVVVQFQPEHIELAEAFADIFVEQALAQEDSRQYLWWLKANLFDETEDTEWHEYLQFLFRLMPSDQTAALAQQLTTEGIFQQVAQNRRELESGLGSKTLIEKDPLNLVKFAGTYSKEITGNYQLNFTEGFLVSKDRDMLLILGKPTRSPEDVDFSVALDAFLQAEVKSALSVLAEEEDVEADQLLSVELTGPHPITAHENRIIKGDVVNMFVTSFAMVLFLFILAYGRPLAMFYVGIPLLCAEIWTLGIGYLLFGRLNLLTATFSAVIVGLGIDYAIHIFSRYLDERTRGLEPLPAMEYALSETGLATSVGGSTTALAFLAMGLSNFSGLREFAAIAATGIALCLLQMFVLLPALVFLRERMRRIPKKVQRAQWDFHLEKLLTVLLRHKNVALTLITLFTLFMVSMSIQLRFNTDVRSVRARSNPAINLQNEVTAKVGGSLRSLSFVLEASNEEDLYALHDSLLPTLAELKQEGSLVRYDSLLVVLQHPQRQAKNLSQLNQAGISGEQIVADFRAAMDKHSLRMTPESDQYIRSLAKGLEPGRSISLKEIIEANSNFVRPFLNYRDNHFKTLIHVYPSTGLWEKQATRELTKRIMESAVKDSEVRPPGKIFVTGIQTIAEELKQLVRNSFKYSTGLAILLILVTLLLHYRTPSLVLLTLTPLLIAVVWMLGTMKLLGIDITILNFVATPIIIGIGIDDGVHIVEKYLYRTSDQTGKLIASCGKAVTLTSLTTMFGFSSLFMAEYSGFRSLGLCSILGVFYCWMGSVILLPLLMDHFKVRFVRNQAQEV